MADTILYLITSLDYGGAQKNLFEIVRRAREAGFNVAVASIKEGGIYKEKFKSIGIATRTLGVSSGRENPSSFLKILLLPFFYFKAFVKLLLFAECTHAQVIHSFLFQANILGRVASKFLNIKNISSVRVIEREKKWAVLLSRLSAFMSDMFTVNSSALYDFVVRCEGVPSEKVSLINNYLDTAALPNKNPLLRMKFGFSAQDFVVVSAGRLEKQKGFEYLIEAAALIREEVPALRVAVAGDGSLYDFLTGIVKKRNLGEIVKFIGARQEGDVFELMAGSDLFVLPSLWEGFPNVVLESIAIGIPVIATDTSCVEGFIEDDFIVKSADAVPIAQKILEVYNDRRKAHLSVEKSASKLSGYSSEKIFNKYFDIYRNL